MTFVTSDQDRTRLEYLTQLLVGTFPGCTIYQHTNPLHAPRDVLYNKVSCVFLEAEMDQIDGISLMQLLHSKRPELPVVILSRSDDFRRAAMEAGASRYLLHPVSEQTLLDAASSFMD